MSKPYVIRVRETARRHIVVEDGIEAQLDVLEILPRAEMSDLLAAELARAGFEGDGGVHRKTAADGVEIRVDVANRSVHVGAREAGAVEHTVDRDVRVRAPDATDTAREGARREAEHAIEAERGRRRVALTERVERALADARAELDDVVVAVLRSALRSRAEQIGSVTSVEEEESGSMTIRVRV